MALGSAGGAKRFFEAEGYDPRTSNVLRMLGYFSLVGLSRVHGLIGDFYTSLQALHPINPFLKKNLYTSKVAGEACLAREPCFRTDKTTVSEFLHLLYSGVYGCVDLQSRLSAFLAHAFCRKIS